MCLFLLAFPSPIWGLGAPRPVYRAWGTPCPIPADHLS